MMVKIEIEGGYYLFKLQDILLQKKISKSKLMKETNTDFKVIQRIVNGELTKFDIIVLARICNFLDCHISDIIEYYPVLKQDLEKISVQ